MLEFLPIPVREALKHINANLLYEIRLRANRSVKINYQGEYVYLGTSGIVKRQEQSLKTTVKEVENCVFAASGYSVYSVSEQMKECFLTTEEGVRLGLAGTLVRENGKTVALRDVTSVCIRIPHPIENCADMIFDLCQREKIHNCILLSAPGYGKTTILRELSRLISENYPEKNLLIVDERGEISSFDAGDGCDILKFAHKKEAFSFGLRALRPDVIITDELQEEDYPAIKKAIDAGLKVVASAHFGKDIREFNHKIFERYVCFGNNKIGQAAAIYDENLKNIL